MCVLVMHMYVYVVSMQKCFIIDILLSISIYLSSDMAAIAVANSGEWVNAVIKRLDSVVSDGEVTQQIKHR